MTKKTLPTVVTLYTMLFVVSSALATPAPSVVRSYVWYGELVGVNQNARMAILKAEFREHVRRYIDQFKPGDRVILTWVTSGEGKTDDIIYVGQYDKSSGSHYGYVLPVELVSIDKTNRTITFKMPVPAKALRTLKSMQTGDQLKVTAPFDQPTDTAAIVSVEPSEGRHKPTSAPSTRS